MWLVHAGADDSGPPATAATASLVAITHQAFASAWTKACSLDNAVFLVPASRRYKVGAIQFVGPCKDNRMIIQVIVVLLQFSSRRQSQS